MNARLGNTRSPELVEVLRAATQQAINQLFVAMPAKVVTYTVATQMANVQPLLQRPVVFDDGTEDVDELPIIPGVPVVFPRGGGGYFITFPLVPGDLVLLVFCDRSIDKYKSSPGTTPVNPIDLRTNDISDAVAIPGFYPVLKALKDGALNKNHMALGKENGAQVHIKADTSIELLNKLGVVSLGATGILSVNGTNLEVLP